MNSHQEGERNANWRGGPVWAECRQCGRAYFAPRWEMKRRRYCSTSCSVEARSLRRCRRKVVEHQGWRFVYAPDHPHASRRGYVREHVMIAAAALGKPLPPGVVVHHINEIRRDNAHRNLVICQDQAYHLLLHARARTVRAGGNPSTEKVCGGGCGRVRPKTEFYPSPRAFDGLRPICKVCHADRYAARRSA